MTGRTNALHRPEYAQEDRVLAAWGDDEQNTMWAQLGQHVHPHDIETERALRQNNGSAVGTTSAYERAQSQCPVSRQAFAHLCGQYELGQRNLPTEAFCELDAICFNGLQRELVSLDIHQDHYQPPLGHNAKRVRFDHVSAQDFAALAVQMPRLKRIEVTCASLTGAFVQALCSGLSEQPIEELVLHHCGLVAQDVQLLLTTFGAHLRALDVSYNNLRWRGFDTLDFSLAPNLQLLDVSHCGLDLADLNLTSCEALVSLNVSSNSGGSSFLMGHDMGSMPELQVLQLNRTQLVGGSLSHLDLSGNTALHTLDLGYNALRNDDMHKFSLPQNPAIQRLNVSGNAIGAAGFVTLQHKGLKHLADLDFADNNLTDYARLHALHGPSLRLWPELRYLDLAGCEGITKAAVVALGLQDAPKLAFFDLSATQLNDDVFQALPWGRMKALQTFRAEYNHITARGIEAARFETCQALQALDLKHHGMTLTEALQSFLHKECLTLQWLSIAGSQDSSGQSLGTDAAQALVLQDRLHKRMGPNGTLVA